MTPDEASSRIESTLLIQHGDIMRAKYYILQGIESYIPLNTDKLALQWLQSNNLTIPKEIEIDSLDASDRLDQIAHAYSLRLALFQAVTELVSAGELIPATSPELWQANLTWKTSRGGGGLHFNKINYPVPTVIFRTPFVRQQPIDTDIFLQGIDCVSLHPGIREAIDQALGCFRRDLYFPATVMLASAAEATWLECGLAVAMNLSDAKLQELLSDQYKSLSLKVTEIRKVLNQPKGKVILKAAGQSSAKISDAELWTTTLRDRRNALHWGKKRSLIAEHSDTASLLLASPLHIGTLEATRRQSML
jgi:hypothetical protein